MYLVELADSGTQFRLFLFRRSALKAINRVLATLPKADIIAGKAEEAGRFWSWGDYSIRLVPLHLRFFGSERMPFSLTQAAPLMGKT
jgi:hypothetical protein